VAPHPPGEALILPFANWSCEVPGTGGALSDPSPPQEHRICLSRLLRVVAAGAAIAALPDSARAQSPPSSAIREATGTPIRCDGDTVTRVEVSTRRPAFDGHSARWRRAARAVGLHHQTTRAGLVRRFVALGPGAVCTEFRRAESERLLRAQPFLASADVRAVPDGPGRVRIEVVTEDEVPVVGNARFRGVAPTALAVGNTNLFGIGLHLEGRLEQGFAYRDGIGVRLGHPQLFGRPYQLAIDAMRRPLGEHLRLELAHPFLTDLQRIAWQATYGDATDYVRFARDGQADAALRSSHRAWDVGGVVRLGGAGHVVLVGSLLSGDAGDASGTLVELPDSGSVELGIRPNGGAPYRSWNAVRVSGVLGMRALEFRRVRAFESLHATQDVARGIQVGMLAGRGIRQLGSADEDVLVLGDVYVGAGGARSFAALRLFAEGRTARIGEPWDGLIGSGRMAWYLRPFPSNTLVLSSDVAGGWRARLPYFLELGDREGGVRGFRSTTTGGARRAVVRLEDRMALGSVRRRADIGLALFADAGRIWAGDVPYASATPTVASVGVSLLAAFPRGSQRLWRADLAMPVRGGARSLELRVVNSDRTRTFWEEPRDVARAREGVSTGGIFTLP